jgi:hypothetical protein
MIILSGWFVSDPLPALADEITYQICVPATRVLYFCIRGPDVRLFSVYDIRGDDRGILDENDVLLAIAVFVIYPSFKFTFERLHKLTDNQISEYPNRPTPRFGEAYIAIDTRPMGM